MTGWLVLERQRVTFLPTVVDFEQSVRLALSVKKGS